MSALRYILSAVVGLLVGLFDIWMMQKCNTPPTSTPPSQSIRNPNRRRNDNRTIIYVRMDNSTQVWMYNANRLRLLICNWTDNI